MSDIAENLWVGFCMECTGLENDFELIATVKTETRHPVEGLFGNEFSATYNRCGVMAT